MNAYEKPSIALSFNELSPMTMEGLDEGLDNKDPHFQNAIEETHPPLQGSPLRLLIFGADIDHEDQLQATASSLMIIGHSWPRFPLIVQFRTAAGHGHGSRLRQYYEGQHQLAARSRTLTTIPQEETEQGASGPSIMIVPDVSLHFGISISQVIQHHDQVSHLDAPNQATQGRTVQSQGTV